MKSVVYASLLTICWSPFALAQQPGSPAYNTRVLPAHGLGDTKQNAPNRWGAFAASLPDGASGVGLDKPHQAIAEEDAMAQCRDSGGTNCEVSFVFLNQCAAVASTATEHAWARGMSSQKVRADAMAACNGADCEIIFEHCMR